MKPRIAIIGGGVAGCSTARRAAELGADVVVFERGTPACASSGLSAGVISAQTLDPRHIGIRVLTRDILWSLGETRGLPYTRIGAIRMTSDPADVARFEHAAAVQHELGATNVRVLAPDDIRRLVPDVVCDGIVAGLYGPDEGHIDGHLYCGAMLDEARALGAQLRSNTAVTGYRKANGVHRLQTSDGEFACDVVVNAAGAWAGRIGEMLGHPAPVRPDVHEVVIAKLSRDLGYAMPFCNFYVPGQDGEAVYFRQDTADTLVTGLHTYTAVPGAAVTDPDAYAPVDSEAYLAAVAEQLYERLPLDDLGVKCGWFGMYPLSADEEFIIGPYAADSSVIAIAGFGGIGMTSGAGAGVCAAEWAVLGRLETLPAADAWRPDRATLQDLW